jgi:hypothetical protein
VRPSRDEIIEARMLAGLALIAEANDRSLIEELNLAVQAYVLEQMPQRLGASTVGAIGVGQVETQEHSS